MDWTKDTVLSFINFIRDRPVIWDTQSSEYKNRSKRNYALEEVAMLMDVSVNDVNRKWQSLRNQFTREKRKMKASGSDYTTKWFAYKELEDLMPSSTHPFVNIHYNEENDLPVNPIQSCNPLIERKRKSDSQRLVYNEPEESVMRERRHDSDDLARYGSYIAAHLRKYSPRLQSKAKYEINNILYRFDMESLGPYTPSASSDCGSPYSSEIKSNLKISTSDDQDDN